MNRKKGTQRITTPYPRPKMYYMCISLVLSWPVVIKLFNAFMKKLNVSCVSSMALFCGAYSHAVHVVLRERLHA